MTKERRRRLYKAAVDFFWLLNRRYPRQPSLDLVGNRYDLDAGLRHVLNRGVFAREEAQQRRIKRCDPARWNGHCLMVDGHNVHITVESALLHRTLLIGNDGAMRDTAGQSAAYRMNVVTSEAVERIVRFVALHQPASVEFLFDAPMSHSGELAARYRSRLRTLGINGKARAVAVPEREFLYEQCVIASSDRVVLDSAQSWTDLARPVIHDCILADRLIDFSFLMKDV